MTFDPRDLDDLVALHRCGSLTAAARQRQVAISTVSRRLLSLERALGIQLTQRLSSGTKLTEKGMALARLAEPLSDQLAKVTRAADALRLGGERTVVRVSATEFVVSDVLAPALADFLKIHDNVTVHLQAQGDIVSLANRSADIAVRMSRPQGASLYARRLPEIELRLYASPAYLQGRDPGEIDLRAEALLIYDDSYGALPELSWIDHLGLAGNVALRTGSTRGLLEATRAGAGIAMLPAAFASDERQFTEIASPFAIPPRQPWLIIHRDSRSSRAVRQVQQWIIRAFARIR